MNELIAKVSLTSNRVETNAIEVKFNSSFEKTLGVKVVHPGRYSIESGDNTRGARSCDGYFEYCSPAKKDRPMLAIMEYKYKAHDLRTSHGRACVLVQVLFYIHDFEQYPFAKTPNVILLADEKNAIVIQVNKVILNLVKRDNINWNSIAPSSAYDCPSCRPLVNELEKCLSNGEIPCSPFDLAQQSFTFEKITNCMQNYANNIAPNPGDIGKNNLRDAFNDFCKYELTGNEKTKNTDYRLCEFVTRLCCGGWSRNGKFGHLWRTSYSRNEISSMLRGADMCYPTKERQVNGDFWTPNWLVDYAKKMIDDTIPNWRDECVVYDFDPRIGNLISGLKIKNGLYTSSPSDERLNIIQHLNPNATVFNFDFLNDDIENLEPHLLRDIKNGKKNFLFFSNPVYATACNHGSSSKTIDAKHTLMNKIMTKNKIGKCKENLLSQFIYRIIMLKEQFNINISIALFANPIFLSGGTYDGLRKVMAKNFRFKDAILVKSKEFGTKGDEGISFSIWTSK